MFDVIIFLTQKWHIAEGNITSGTIRSRKRNGRLRYASILDTPVTAHQLYTRLLNTNTDIFCAPGRIQLVRPVQLLFWAFTGGGRGAYHGIAERCCRDLQPVHANDVPESLSK